MLAYAALSCLEQDEISRTKASLVRNQKRHESYETWRRIKVKEYCTTKEHTLWLQIGLLSGDSAWFMNNSRWFILSIKMFLSFHFASQCLQLLIKSCLVQANSQWFFSKKISLQTFRFYGHFSCEFKTIRGLSLMKRKNCLSSWKFYDAS